MENWKYVGRSFCVHWFGHGGASSEGAGVIVATRAVFAAYLEICPLRFCEVRLQVRRDLRHPAPMSRALPPQSRIDAPWGLDVAKTNVTQVHHTHGIALQLQTPATLPPTNHHPVRTTMCSSQHVVYSMIIGF